MPRVTLPTNSRRRTTVSDSGHPSTRPVFSEWTDAEIAAAERERDNLRDELNVVRGAAPFNHAHQERLTQRRDSLESHIARYNALLDDATRARQSLMHGTGSAS